jgi:hypothetical protein
VRRPSRYKGKADDAPRLPFALAPRPFRSRLPLPALAQTHGVGDTHTRRRC